MPNPNRLKLTGKTFGRLQVLSFAGIKNQSTWWNCSCSCGGKIKIRGASLTKTNPTQSCGCLIVEATILRNKLTSKEEIARRTQPRKCRKCNAIKIPAEFYNPHSFQCKTCQNQKNINNHCLLRYGITAAQREIMRARQKYKCAICGKRPSKRQFHTDHNHITGKVREQLCQPCNHMLGNSFDNPELLRLGALYLERHNGTSN